MTPLSWNEVSAEMDRICPHAGTARAWQPPWNAHELIWTRETVKLADVCEVDPWSARDVARYAKRSPATQPPVLLVEHESGTCLYPADGAHRVAASRARGDRTIDAFVGRERVAGTLTPNDPRKRLQWVMKTYWAKDPMSVAQTYDVAVYLFGLEADESLWKLVHTVMSDMTAGTGMSTGQAKQKLTALEERFPKHHAHDFLIPWAARELLKLRAAYLAYEVDGRTAREATDMLRRKAPAIAMWAKETKTDLGRVTLAEALDAVAEYEFKSRKIPQGTVVWTFDDGWTVQELRGDPHDDEDEQRTVFKGLGKLLKAEGDEMQHCVGSYCDAVEQGQSRIYSLRDPNGHPHVTMEWSADNERIKEFGGVRREVTDLDPEAFLRSSVRHRGYIAQVYGKQNDKPAAKYVPYVRTFLTNAFPHDVAGLLSLGVPAKEISFRHAVLPREFYLSGLDLSGADFTSLHALDVRIHNSHLRGAKFVRATLSNASIHECNMESVDFSGADLREASFLECQLGDARFVKTDLTNAEINKSDISEAVFDRAQIDQSVWVNIAASMSPSFEDVKGAPDFANHDLASHFPRRPRTILMPDGTYNTDKRWPW